MACECENCGNPTYDCGERLCQQCFIDSLPDNTSKNIASGGRFYKEDLEPKVENPIGYAEL